MKVEIIASLAARRRTRGSSSGIWQGDFLQLLPNLVLIPRTSEGMQTAFCPKLSEGDVKDLGNYLPLKETSDKIQMIITFEDLELN